ncbi:DNA-binding domain-containing protein, partial [Spirochaeta cellobiosiphila]|uniref:DNA-binding domain-containing protein n=1 Tax=Spirochaeta cellobiosiphila TaxID=504483 RepID=UPI00055E4447
TEVVRDELLSGNRIITDLFQASVSIKGGFATDSTDYDSNVHYVKPNFTASAKLRKDIVSKAGVSKVDPGQKVPKVSLVYDIRYGTYGPHYPIGGIIEVKGKNFTLDEELEILLVSDFSGESVGGVHLLKITPSSILCQLPDTLEAGEYTMIVVVGTGDGALRGTYKTMMSIS